MRFQNSLFSRFYMKIEKGLRTFLFSIDENSTWSLFKYPNNKIRVSVSSRSEKGFEQCKQKFADKILETRFLQEPKKK